MQLAEEPESRSCTRSHPKRKINPRRQGEKRMCLEAREREGEGIVGTRGKLSLLLISIQVRKDPGKDRKNPRCCFRCCRFERDTERLPSLILPPRSGSASSHPLATSVPQVSGAAVNELQ